MEKISYFLINEWFILCSVSGSIISITLQHLLWCVMDIMLD